MSNGDDILHDLNDRLNGILLSVELAIQLLKDKEASEVTQILSRVRDDCSSCSKLVDGLRESR